MPQRLRRPAGPHIWTKHTSFLSHSYYYHFFLLSYKHFTQAGPVMQLVMFDVPLKLKKITPRITNSSVTHYTNGFRGIIKVHEINV